MNSEAEKQLAEEAKRYVKENKKAIIEKFASLSKYSPTDKPFTLFMAGSPGAGKTEFSKSYIQTLSAKNPDIQVVRIDADEVRECLPQYNGKNSSVVQGACAIAVEKLYDHIQKHKQNAIIDGTFAHYEVSYKDVKRALDKNRTVEIYYIYQDPIIAWDFTKKREAIEHRHVSKQVFIDCFFSARDNVNKIKEQLGNQIELTLITKNYDNLSEKAYFNIQKIDSYLKLAYNRKELEEQL